VLTPANAAGTSGLTCLSKHGGARDNTFFVYEKLLKSQNWLHSRFWFDNDAMFFSKDV
jgi:hypothetical protein